MGSGNPKSHPSIAYLIFPARRDSLLRIVLLLIVDGYPEEANAMPQVFAWA
jgi:hypothetical protein